MTKLNRLKIIQYRNVKPCELVFSDRFNILLGPNGAGKTTLLNLISEVLRSNRAGPRDEFAFEIGLTFPGGTLAGSIRNTGAEEALAGLSALESAARAAIRGNQQRARWPPDFELRLELAQPPLVSVVTREESTLVVKDSSGGKRARRFGFMPLYGFLDHVINAAGGFGSGPTIIEDLRNAARFDESLDTFRAMTARRDDNDLSSHDLRPLVNIVNLIAEGMSGVIAVSTGIVPGAMLDEVRDRFLSGDTDVDVSLRQDKLKFLSETVRLLGFASAEARMELTEKKTQQGSLSEDYNFGNLKLWFTRRDGSVFPDHQLSYGQKRLLAFLYYLDANPSFVIADELVNGLHHAWLEECMDAIGDRQAFLTSQNPLLLDYLSFESVEEVKATFILCRTEVVAGREQMIWRNLTDDEADMFYGAYRVGIEHVGEILRTRGLW